MRKIIISILVLCLLALSVYMVVDQISIGKLEILGIKQILKKNDELDEKIAQAKEKSEVEMEQEKSNLEQAFKQMNSKKSEYEELVSASTVEEVKFASQFLTYEVEFLWTEIGNYAKEETVKLKIDFNSNTTVANNYDLAFTVTGSYIGITDFIYDIENDSELGFKIENFGLVKDTTTTTNNTQTTETNLIATFTCKNITVNGIEKTNQNTTNNTTENNSQTNASESNNTTGQ